MILYASSVNCYHRDNGPVLGAFEPQYVQLSEDCEEGNNNYCLRIPSRKICKEKLEKMDCFYDACNPLPWWYFYCQWVVTWRPSTVKTTSRTVPAYFKKELAEFYKFKKGLRRHPNI